MKLKHSLLLLCLSSVILGCGLKGDLYEPTDETVVVNETSQQISQEKTDEVAQSKEEQDLHYQPTESSKPQ